jgi:hypothetical protein
MTIDKPIGMTIRVFWGRAVWSGRRRAIRSSYWTLRTTGNRTLSTPGSSRLGTRALLGVKELLHVILCDFFHFVMFVAYVKNVDNCLAFGARQSGSQQCIVVGLLGAGGMDKIGYRCPEN